MVPVEVGEITKHDGGGNGGLTGIELPQKVQSPNGFNGFYAEKNQRRIVEPF